MRRRSHRSGLGWRGGVLSAAAAAGTRNPRQPAHVPCVSPPPLPGNDVSFTPLPHNMEPPPHQQQQQALPPAASQFLGALSPLADLRLWANDPDAEGAREQQQLQYCRHPPLAFKI